MCSNTMVTMVLKDGFAVKLVVPIWSHEKTILQQHWLVLLGGVTGFFICFVSKIEFISSLLDITSKKIRIPGGFVRFTVCFFHQSDGRNLIHKSRTYMYP